LGAAGAAAHGLQELILRISIIQSCYIPWKGFFDLIGRCDEYVVYDSAQFVKGHWHNRNRIKTAEGTRWLTIPVITSDRLRQSIRDVEISEKWADRHWSSIEQAYRTAVFFREYAPLVMQWYEQADRTNRLSEINLIFISGIASLLGITTRITSDLQYPLAGTRSEKVLSIAQAAGADRYLSGPAAKVYLDESIFAAAGISVEWMSYDNYRPYPQLHGDFVHTVSSLDMLFNTGPDAWRYFKPNAATDSI
jgi:hypothetical protein